MDHSPISLLDLARDPEQVARELRAWQRGDRDEAVAATLRTCAGRLHGRDYTLWVWAGRTPDDEPVWLLPIDAGDVEDFSPRGPMRALTRCLDAALLYAGAAPEMARLEEWHGLSALVAPDLDPEFGAYALSELHPSPSRAVVARLPDELTVSGPELTAERIPADDTDGLRALAHELSVHPLQVALTLIAHGQPASAAIQPRELASALREWGCVGSPPAPTPADPSLAVDDDPCPRRRHARRVLRRLLRVGKVGVGYHTEFANLYRGAPPDERQQALEVGEALLRAGLLGEKPSVGQRHVYLRREALPEIHALIERGQTGSPQLEELWTAPAPGVSERP